MVTRHRQLHRVQDKEVRRPKIRRSTAVPLKLITRVSAAAARGVYVCETSPTEAGKGKGKCFLYSIPSVGPGADPGVQAVSPQVTVSHPPSGIGCHYFPPGLQLSPQPQSITALWPVPSYTAW